MPTRPQMGIFSCMFYCPIFVDLVQIFFKANGGVRVKQTYLTHRLSDMHAHAFTTKNPNYSFKVLQSFLLSMHHLKLIHNIILHPDGGDNSWILEKDFLD